MTDARMYRKGSADLKNSLEKRIFDARDSDRVHVVSERYNESGLLLASCHRHLHVPKRDGNVTEIFLFVE